MKRRKFLKTALLAIAGAVLGKGLSGEQVGTNAELSAADKYGADTLTYEDVEKMLSTTHKNLMRGQTITVRTNPLTTTDVKVEYGIVNGIGETQWRSLPFYGDSDCPGRPAFSWDEDDEPQQT